MARWLVPMTDKDHALWEAAPALRNALALILPDYIHCSQVEQEECPVVKRRRMYRVRQAERALALAKGEDHDQDN